MGKASRVKGAYKEKNRDRVGRELTLNELRSKLRNNAIESLEELKLDGGVMGSYFNSDSIKNRTMASLEVFRILLKAMSNINGTGRYNTLVFRLRPPELFNAIAGEKLSLYVEKPSETVTILTWDVIEGEWTVFTPINNNFNYFVKILTESLTVEPQNIPEGYEYKSGILVAGLFNSTVPTLNNPTQEELANAPTSLDNESYGWRVDAMTLTPMDNLIVNPGDKEKIKTDKTLNIYREYLLNVAQDILNENAKVEELEATVEIVKNNVIFKKLLEYSLMNDGGYIVRIIDGEGSDGVHRWDVIDGVEIIKNSRIDSLKKLDESFNGGDDEVTLILEVNNENSNIVYGWRISGGGVMALENSSMVELSLPEKYRRVKTLHARSFLPGFDLNV